MSETKKRDIRSLPASKLTDAELIEMLTKRYEPSVIPPCRVCGAKLRIGAIGGGQPTRWACPKAQGKDGMDWAHYRQSGFEDRRHGGDSDAIQLIKRFNRNGTR